MKIRELCTELKKLSETYGNKYVGVHLKDKNELIVDEPLSVCIKLREHGTYKGLYIYIANDDYNRYNARPKTLMDIVQKAIVDKASDYGKQECSAIDLLEVSEYPVYIVNEIQTGKHVYYDEFEIVPCLDECTQPKSETETDNSFSDLKVLVDNVAYYKIMKRQICFMKNNTLAGINEFLKKLPTYSEINYFSGGILDFNWQGMALSIYPSSDGYFLGDEIEMWNDETCTSLGAFTHVSEVESAIEEKIDCIINQLENLKGHCEDFCDDDESIWKKDINALNVAIDCIKEFSKGRVY